MKRTIAAFLHLQSVLASTVGLLLLFYAIAIPFLGINTLLTILPVTALGLYLEMRSPWSNAPYPVVERVGDLVSLVMVWLLSLLQGQIEVFYSNPLPSSIQPLIGILIVDGLAYGIHRLSHLILWLWKFHRVHHSRNYPSVLNTCYENITDASLRLIGPGVILVLLGFDQNTVVTAGLMSTLFGIISHINCSIKFPNWIQKIFVTPQAHQIHHDLNKIDKNCGAITLLWDHLFGTFELYEMEPKDYGLKDSEKITNAWWHIFITIKKDK